MNSAHWGRICLSWSWIQSFFLLCSQIVLHFVVIGSLYVHRSCCILLLQISLCSQIVLHFVVMSLCSHTLLSVLWSTMNVMIVWTKIVQILEMLLLLLLFPLIFLSILIIFKKACTSLRVSYNVCARVIVYFCSLDSILLSLPAIVGESLFTLAILLQGLL
jgi:hypothetical protein